MLVTPSNGSGGSGLSIRTGHNFKDNTERDTYFATHKTELKKSSTLIFVSGTPQFLLWIGENLTDSSVYDNTKWDNVSAVVRGEKGEQGNKFTYADFTQEQLKSLKGEAFVYADFTQEQLALLKGEQGLKGDRPNYEWEETRIRFEKPDGSWGSFVDLIGKTGRIPKYDFDKTSLRFENQDGTMGEYVNLKGDKGYSSYDLYKLSVVEPNIPLTEAQWLDSLNGKGFVIKEGYKNNVTYHFMDVVTYLNIMWVCQNDEKNNPNGVVAITPGENDVIWKKMLEVVPDSSTIIRDDLVASSTYAYSVNKFNTEMAKKANKDEVLRVGSSIPFTATLPGEPVCLQFLKDSNSTIVLDKIPDTANFKKSQENFDTNLKNKLISLQDSNKGYFASLSLLHSKYPNGTLPSDTLRVGDFAIVGGDGAGTYWFFNSSNVWEDTGNKNGTGLAEQIYDPRSIRKDIFSMDSMTETDTKKIMTDKERENLSKLDPMKLMGVPIADKTLKDNTIPVYDDGLGMFTYKDYIDSDLMACYSADGIKRKDMKADESYNRKYFVVFDTTLRLMLLYHPDSKQFSEYKAQRIIKSFPTSPTDGMEFQGTTYLFKYKAIDDFWEITGEIAKPGEFETIKTNNIQSISNYMNLLDSKGDNQGWYNDIDNEIMFRGNLRIVGDIICPKLYDHIDAVQGYRVMTATDFKTFLNGNFLNPVDENRKLTIWNISDDVLINVKGRTAYQVNQHSTLPKEFPATFSDGQIFVNGKALYKYNGTKQYWVILAENFEKYQHIGTEPFITFNYSGAINDYLKFEKINESPFKWNLSIGTTRNGMQNFKIYLRKINSSVTNTIANEFYFNNQPDTNQLIIDLTEKESWYELSVVNITYGVIFNTQFMCLPDGYMITGNTDAEIFTGSKDYDYKLCTTYDRKNSLITSPKYFKYCYDLDLKKVLIINSSGQWREDSGKYEEIIFPLI